MNNMKYNMDKSKDLAILVYSCWKNSDMWTIFLSLFGKYWSDCSYRLILLTDKILADKKEYDFDDVVVLDANWYDMLMAGVDRAGTPYVMLWMDDYLLYDYINNSDIEYHLKSAVKYHAANIRFVQTSIMPVKSFEKDAEYDVCEPGEVYSLSTQIGIWDVSFLKKVIRPEWTPWEFERKGSLLNVDHLHPLLITKNYTFPYEEAIKQGKWLENGVRLCNREHISIDFKRRKAMSSFETSKLFFMKGILEMNPLFIVKIQNFLMDKQKDGRNKVRWIEKGGVSSLGNKCMRFASYFKIDRLCYKAAYYFYRKYPTPEMIESRRFYKKNRERISKCLSYLYDDRSKQIFMKMICFRCNKDYRKFPGYEANQYFVQDIMKFNENEVFIDGGGYNGDTTMEFINRVEGHYKKVVIFEPDVTNYNLMKKVVEKKKNIIAYNMGLYDTTTKLTFKSGEDVASRIDEQGDFTVPVVALDDLEECKDATFIKMDIEGAELKALAGAKNIIISNAPKLAICLYHSDADMLEIIEYVHELVPSYKLYVRHHSPIQNETVLYAVQ